VLAERLLQIQGSRRAAADIAARPRPDVPAQQRVEAGQADRVVEPAHGLDVVAKAERVRPRGLVDQRQPRVERDEAGKAVGAEAVRAHPRPARVPGDEPTRATEVVGEGCTALGESTLTAATASSITRQSFAVRR
jgi:hypothetical protein